MFIVSRCFHLGLFFYFCDQVRPRLPHDVAPPPTSHAALRLAERVGGPDDGLSRGSLLAPADDRRHEVAPGKMLRGRGAWLPGLFRARLERRQQTLGHGHGEHEILQPGATGGAPPGSHRGEPLTARQGAPRYRKIHPTLEWT